MQWFDNLPQENGEYIFVKYIECGCCIDYIGYAWVMDRIDKEHPLSYNYVSDDGQLKTMYFEGIKKEELPIVNGKIYVDGWCRYLGPKNTQILC